MKDKLKEIGSRIRQIRKEQNLNQVALGIKLGLSAQAVSKYENGESDAGAITFQKIAEIGEKSLDWLLTGKELDDPSQDQRYKQQVKNLREVEKDRHDALNEETISNFDLLTQTIAAIESWLKSENLVLATEDKAKLITICYKDQLNRGKETVDLKGIGLFMEAAKLSLGK